MKVIYKCPNCKDKYLIDAYLNNYEWFILDNFYCERCGTELKNLEEWN